MMSKTENNLINSKYVGVMALAVIFSWLIHEFAHWVAGNMLGYDMVMRLNSGYPSSLHYTSASHYQIISAAAPLITLLEALIVFFIMRRRENKMLYPFLFTCFYMRFFAAVISILNPNDEARISKWLGIGTFTLPVIMTAILFLLVYKITKQYGFSKTFNAKNLGLVIFFTSIVILADQFFHIRLL